MTWTTSEVAAIYKERFQGGIAKLLPQKSEVFAMFRHESDKGGEPWQKVLRTNAVRASTRPETAIAQTNAPSYSTFTINQANMGEEHCVVELSTKVLRSTANNESALVKAIEEAVDTELEAVALRLDHKLLGDGGGNIGRVEPASVSAATFQLQDTDYLYFWYAGLRIEAAPDNGKTAAAGVRSGVLEVSGLAVDGTITCTQNITTGIPAFDDTGAATAVDFLFAEDDYDAQAERIVQGLRAWVPQTAPSGGESWFGVDRSTHESALAGSRVTGSGAHVFDVLRDARARTTQNRGKPDTLVIGTFKMAEIEQVVGAKQEFMLKTDYPDVGIAGIKMNTAGGPIDVIAQPAMPSAEAVLFKRDAFVIGSMGEVPHDVDEDGLTWRVVTGKAAVQHRCEAYLQLMLEEPWHCCHITW